MPERERPLKSGLTYLVVFIFLGLPALMGYGAIPLTNFTAEALSPVGLALMLGILALEPARSGRPSSRTGAGLLALALLFVVTFVQYWVMQRRGTESYLVILGYLFCAGLALWAGSEAARGARADRWFDAVAVGFGFTAVLAAAASVMQYFAIDGQLFLISPAKTAGRAYGFFRQANQQGTFLNLGLAALFCLHLCGRLKLWPWLALSVFVGFAIVTTGSRTALLQTGFMALCALGLRPLGKDRFKALIPLVAIAAIWLGLYVASMSGGATFYGAEKLDQTLTEGVGMRSATWHQTLLLILERPWTGHGILRYPIVYFLHGSGIEVGLNMTHSHNLPLQLAVDYGVPVCLLVLALLAWALWGTRRQWLAPRGFMAAMALACLLIHSLFEFPLWYTYFLLPGCWLLGWLTAGAPEPEPEPVAAARRRWLRPAFCVLSAGLALSATLSMNRDYFLLTPAYSPGLTGTQLQRVEDSKQAFWFSRYSEFAQLQVAPQTVAGASAHVERAAKLGCVMNEIWYQRATLSAMAQAGYLDDAKWILYVISRMTQNGMAAFRAEQAESPLPGAAELVRYLDDPLPAAVPRSTRLYDQYCTAR